VYINIQSIIYIYIYIKKDKILSFGSKMKELDDMMLSEISQTQKDKHHILSDMWKPKNQKPI
jgi:hypothetical protein